MHIQSLLALSAICVSSSLYSGITAGPMLAHLEMREAKIWLQAKEPSLVRIAYSVVGREASTAWSTTVETDSNKGHTAVVTLDQIEPGLQYSYQVETNGVLATESASFTAPENYHDKAPPPDFSIAVGGAHYAMEEGFEPPYQVIGGGYGIFNTIAQSDAKLMIWAGNTAHLRVSDWNTQSGFLKRYSNARSMPELAPLLASIPHYAVWGRHDFGAPKSGRLSATRTIAETSFEAYWPRPIEVAHLEGVATQFRYADADFFLLDTQSYRYDMPDSQSRVEILGKPQVAWLRQALMQSNATFKIIVAGAPILNPANSRENLSFAESEHTEFLQMLRTERISGLIFLSGGKPYGELTRLVHANSYNLYDLTLGPMTASPSNEQEELNFFRMPGSSTFERHFALIDFRGPEENRLLRIRVMSVEGQELWSRTIPAKDLQPSKR